MKRSRYDCKHYFAVFEMESFGIFQDLRHVVIQLFAESSRWSNSAHFCLRDGGGQSASTSLGSWAAPNNVRRGCNINAPIESQHVKMNYGDQEPTFCQGLSAQGRKCRGIIALFRWRRDGVRYCSHHKDQQPDQLTPSPSRIRDDDHRRQESHRHAMRPGSRRLPRLQTAAANSQIAAMAEEDPNAAESGRVSAVAQDAARIQAIAGPRRTAAAAVSRQLHGVLREIARRRARRNAEVARQDKQRGLQRISNALGEVAFRSSRTIDAAQMLAVGHEARTRLSPVPAAAQITRPNADVARHDVQGKRRHISGALREVAFRLSPANAVAQITAVISGALTRLSPAPAAGQMTAVRSEASARPSPAPTAAAVASEASACPPVPNATRMTAEAGRERINRALQEIAARIMQSRIVAHTVAVETGKEQIDHILQEIAARLIQSRNVVEVEMGREQLNRVLQEIGCRSSHVRNTGNAVVPGKEQIRRIFQEIAVRGDRDTNTEQSCRISQEIALRRHRDTNIKKD